jgi:hypothetical protein
MDWEWSKGYAASFWESSGCPKGASYAIGGRIVFHYTWIYVGLHIYREGNACAGKIANLGHSFVDLKWWNSMPLELRDVALHDMLGLSSYRFD